MRATFLIGRILAGGFFLVSGAQLISKLEATAHHVAARGVPMPEAAVVLAGILLIVGGLSLILGMAPKVGVAALALFLIPVTLIMHQFWNATGAARMAEMINFTKNVGLLGAVLMLAAIPEPWPLSIRGRLPLRRPGRLAAFNH